MFRPAAALSLIPRMPEDDVSTNWFTLKPFPLSWTWIRNERWTNESFTETLDVPACFATLFKASCIILYDVICNCEFSRS
jgi:hypothetical protein